ncbi:hypothetical protein LTR78_001523 [Recurvomyces mirabilis]|uniref:Uncharacterized protein n=1 Tax=Recurvomyces mirabilis TaxID=574656 RepID=A0AAE0WVV4_9PEZI|nr:hypothetical protein LTR78_001523 [Recurvomyces mirabilis]KAK5161502.1 hypothetical protein LTS14_001298 [Recurvomyces mirabilis]
MAGKTPNNSVWSAMDYTPPRGRCNFKSSLMSPACPCLRFMLHPVKAATSFDCDGCSHHASFHSLDNPAEDAVLKKWAQHHVEEKASQSTAITAKKRKFLTQTAANAEVFDMTSDDHEETVYAPVLLAGKSRSKKK